MLVFSNLLKKNNRMKTKYFKLSPDQITQLVPATMGGSLATDKIMVDGLPIGRMQREQPINEKDNGWIFTAGDEDEFYLNDINNWGTYSVNSIANLDRAVIPYLRLPIGTKLIRVQGTDDFTQVNR
jgi:hypothetical protein